MSKIKIILFSISGAGVKRHLMDIALSLDKGKYEVIGIFPDKLLSSVVSKDQYFTYKALFQKAGLKYYILEIPRELSLWIDLKSIGQLRKILRTEHPDILHCHSSLAGALGRLAVFTMSKPKPKVIYTPNLMYYQQSKGLKRQVYWSIEKILWPLSNAIIAAGESEYSALSRDFAPVKGLFCINNGINVENGVKLIPDARNMLCQELELGGSVQFILSLARLEPQKDVLTLLRAFIQIAADHPEAVLLMAGGGAHSQIQEAEHLIRKANLTKRAFLLGWRDDPDVLLSAADIVVLSSNYEGLPYALLEAMAIGKPIVGSAVQGIVDCVLDGQNGFLFEAGNVDACAGALERLLKDADLRERMAAAGRELARRKFNLGDMLKATERIYKRE
jgi:glycosyltransferase involved in cell wall biosynthesis